MTSLFVSDNQYEELDGDVDTNRRRRRRRHSWRNVLRQTTLSTILKISAALAVLFLLFEFAIWEPHIELAFYRRSWIKEEILTVEPLAGCFQSSRLSPHYNLTRAMAPKHRQIQAGMPLRLGMDCYNFAGTISPPRPSDPLLSSERTNYHSYWRADLAPFGPRQEWMLKSFFATQDIEHSRFILWTNGDLLSRSQVLQRWVRRHPDVFEVRVVDVHELAEGTALEGSKLLDINDAKAWVDGDLVRLLVIWAYGGLWVDMDELFTRDLSPLLEHEFISQWDCYDKIYVPFNGAVMHFLQHSPYLCEAFEIMAHSPPPRRDSTDWGSLLYLKLWRRLVAGGVEPFKVLPWCFVDGRSCRLDNRLPDPFSRDSDSWAGGDMKEGGLLDKTLNNVFTVHLHNQWDKAFAKDGWVQRLLLQKFDEILRTRGWIPES
ncbi:glycosyltransferase family 32 protein [Schizopora paradoxa]|uniref:Glycosyltransferase family 32 protein n=1 Tax=Schizopora paradoxa TaxID=27342 RepID=A0A0H2RRE1_9AGAM|nr:glycosyltransferase family 32 protein [Schizopora paradoxa]